MPSTPPLGGPLFVESLEARIAPTGLTAIANDPLDPTATNDPTYVTYTTAPAAGKLGFVPVTTANQYGLVVPAGSAPVYALKLTGNGGIDGNTGNSTGDKLVIFNTTQGFNFANPFLQATNKSLIAFFTDLNGDNQVQTNELTGIAIAKKGAVNVNGNVNGDIVTNLSKDGNTVLPTSVGNANTLLAGITVVGNVNGSVVGGGTINNVSITGNVDNILAGTAANNFTFHFSQTRGANGTLAPVAAGTVVEGAFPALKAGAAINNTTLLSLGGAIHAGDGGFAALGGSVTNTVIQNDVDGFSILGGNGGFGNAATKGAIGGDIATVRILGVPDTGVHSTINIRAGDGGVDVDLKGGAGGSITDVSTSVATFDAGSGVLVASADLLNDNIVVHAGTGGNGVKGGHGGNVSNSALFGAIPDVNGADNAEIQVVAGDGGVGTGGKGGGGGAISQINAQNLDLTAAALTSSILIQGGAGLGRKAGGDLDAITLLGSRLFVAGGNGGDGDNRGGNGGSVNTVRILSTTGVSTHDLTINAGQAGNASLGAGGIGGSIDTVIMNDSDLNLLVINDGLHANGGRSGSGPGGAGGSVTNFQLGDTGAARAVPAMVMIRTGAGGDGLGGGGDGGNIGTVQFFGTDFKYTVTTGTGGSVPGGGTGNGGAGGSFVNVGISNQPFAVADANYAAGATGTIIAGAGGNGDNGGAGGAGGALSQVNVRTTFGVLMTAGNGGTGVGGAAGAGGMVSSSAANSLLGGVSVKAGDGGTVGGAAGDGGAITRFIAAAQGDIAMTSGNGGAGGAGGDITNSGTNLNELTQLPNLGSMLIKAGNGSDANAVAGGGGSVNGFSGYIGYGVSGMGTPAMTAIKAGNGGGGGDARLTGAGGSVNQIKLTGANLTNGGAGARSEIITVDAGDAGTAAGVAKLGGAGGIVNTVTIFNLDSGALVHHIAAGNAADGVKKGGVGGSVTQVHVGTANDGEPDDIGYRTGVAFGYGLANSGGIFAGTGGTGRKFTGAAGDVTDITANAIASIVAGKAATPQLVNTVDTIFLNGTTATTANADGSFANIGTANFVGSVVNPNASGATTFKYGAGFTPIDGLIAALNLTGNHNFPLEAFLTRDGSGVLALTDNQQPNAPVVTAVG